MKKSAIISLLLIFPPPALAFDVNAYCQKVSESVKGGYVIEEGCRKNEEQAKAQLASMTIEPGIKAHCEQVAQSVSAGYQILLGCIKNEQDAKARMGK